MPRTLATTPVRLVAAAAALALVLAACGDDGDKKDESANTTRTAAGTVTIDVRTIEPFGRVLIDGDGRTLYFFDKDQPVKPKSACTGQCATNWPPLLAAGPGRVNGELDESLRGETTRDDGMKQLTWNGLPLYRFNGDTKAGDTNGQGVGGVWHIAGADGNPVMTSTTTTTAA